MDGIGSPALWAGFIVFVLVMLALDLGVFHRKVHTISVKEAGLWSAVWIALALVFGAGIYHFFGSQTALEFATGYVLEKALSVDNIFVFVVIFTSLRVPSELQHRVLFWGVLGALALRAVMIVLGTELLQRFTWVHYVFGGILILTAAKLVFSKEDSSPESNVVYRWVQRVIPTTSDFRGSKFAVREADASGRVRLLATPLLAVLVLVEITDVIFAVDSIPAVFAVTTDPFIVFTSNIFAILGLRSLYFLLHDVVHRFHYLKQGLAIVLAFVGVKMSLMSVYKIPILASLAFIAITLAASIGLSLLRTPRTEGAS